jgi:hypothetical protein
MRWRGRRERSYKTRLDRGVLLEGYGLPGLRLIPLMHVYRCDVRRRLDWDALNFKSVRAGLMSACRGSPAGWCVANDWHCMRCMMYGPGSSLSLSADGCIRTWQISDLSPSRGEAFPYAARPVARI